MTKEELKNKCTERAKIFQQAMESCHSSSLIDCIEWFADRIADLEAQIKKMQDDIDCLTFACENYREEMEKNLADATELEKENAELKADNDARKFAMAMSEKVEKQLREENTKLKTDYKVLSCSVGDFGELQEKLEEEQRKNNGLSDNLTKAKEIIRSLYFIIQGRIDYKGNIPLEDEMYRANQFLNSEVEK